MKRKVVAIFLSIVLIVSLLIPSTLVKAEPNNGQEQGESIEEQQSEEPINGETIEEQPAEEQSIEEQPDMVEDVDETEGIIDPNIYDPVLYKVVLYTLGKTSDDSIFINDLEAITKIDIEELQKNYSDLENITISSFSLLQEIKNLKELNLSNANWNSLKLLNLGDDSWDGIEALSKLPSLSKLKINGCTFRAVEPETTISKELLSKLTIENDKSDGAKENDKILNINLEDINISSDIKSFTIPSIEEMKPVEELSDEDKPNLLSSEIVSEGEWAINNNNVSFSNETFKVEQFPMEIKLSNNRIKAIIKLNVIVDKSLIENEVSEESPIPEEQKPSGDNNEQQEVVNTPPVITASDKTIKVGEEFNPLEGVTANDTEDGDITGQIVVDNKVDINTSGVYEVVYSVKDSQEKETSLTIKVTVEEVSKPSEGEQKPNTPPVITASDKTIKDGDEFNPLEGVTANDVEDGDITNNIVVEGNVDVTKPGEYEIVYKVADSNGEEVSITIKVLVENKDVNTEKELPIIDASDKTINVGDKFEPLEGITAKDKDGNDITKNIEVTENAVNINEAGKYNITYSVKDKYGNESIKTISVTVKKNDEVVNSAPVINTENKIVELGSKFNQLDGVTATDAEDGDVTSRIIVISSNVDVNKEGIYIVTYEVTDKDGASTRKTIEVTVMKPITEENEAPVINASDRTIKVGDKFNPLDGITAFDKEDGNLTSKIKVTENMVDINTIGKYTVTFEVTDSAGKTTTKSINIKVDKAAVPLNKAPVITAYNKIIKTGNKFNPYAGVTASDYEDGNITDKIKVIYNNLDTNVTGLYRIVYEVTDSAGYRVTKGIYVNVIPSSNTRPIIYVDNVIVPLGGRYNPYAMVSAYDKEDGNITGRVVVVYNYVNVYKEGTYKVGYKVTDSMGMSASCIVKVTVKNYYGIEDTKKNQDPVIYANDISIALNSKFNPLEWVAVTDKEDGDITNKVMVIVNDVDTSVEGNYHVTYEVVDSSGNKVNKAMMVYVKEEEKVEAENKPPVINAEDVTLEKGIYFDPLDGVTALDEEDGNLTHKIIVKENEVNVSKAGNYKVTYEATDSMDETTTKSINVIIEGGSALTSNSMIMIIIGGVLLVVVVVGAVVAIVITRKKE